MAHPDPPETHIQTRVLSLPLSLSRSSRSFEMGASSSKADTRPSDKSPSPAAAGGDVTVAKVTQSEESAFEEKEEESKVRSIIRSQIFIFWPKNMHYI